MPHIRTLTLLGTIGVLLSLPLVAVERVEDIPSPRPDSWVTDLSGRLSNVEIGQINALVQDAHRESGAELAVVLVDTIGRQDHRRFATMLFNHWGIGDPARNDGVLLFAALNDRAAELILGDGIDGPQAVRIADSIMQGTMVPAFRADQPGRAMLGGAKAALERIVFPSLDGEGGEGPDMATPLGTDSASTAAPLLPPIGESIAYPSEPLSWWQRLKNKISEYTAAAIGAAGAGIAGLWAGIRRFLRNRPRHCDRCGQQMTRLEENADDVHLQAAERKEELLKSADWDVWMCAACENVTKIQYKVFFTKYSRCPDCGARTMSKNRQTIRSATEYSTGLARITEDCRHCDHHNTYTKTIPRVTRSSSSSSGSSGFSGGSSSGGGSSGRW